MDRLSAALCIFICMNGVYRYSSAVLITPCADDDACQVAEGDANSECLPASGNGACVCKSTHKDNSSGTCVPKGLLDACSKADDCTAVTHATCKGSTCQCEAAYKTESKTCVAREHGDPCTVNGDCTGQLQECSGAASSKVCTCSTGYSYNGTKCVVGHGDTCTVTAVCTGLNLKCDTSKSTHVCACKDGYSQDSTHANCIKGYGDVCTANEDCTGQNLECNDSDPKACACKSGYSKDGVNCIKVPDNSADVTSMAFPVAIALLSIALFGKLC